MKFTCKAYWRSLRKSFDLSKGLQADKHEQYEAVNRRIHSFACKWLWRIGRKIAAKLLNSERKIMYHFIRWLWENAGKREFKKHKRWTKTLTNQKTWTQISLFPVLCDIWIYLNNSQLTKSHLLQPDAAAEGSPDQVKECHRPAVCAGLIPMPSAQKIITKNISISIAMWIHTQNTHS